MAYYDYYRRRNPSSWGRPEYMMDSPPAPGYQPQPQWRGFDYYRAHVDGSSDPSVFDSVWGRVRSHPRAPINRRDAQSWHRRVYGGLADVSTMMPAEIGAAAGYEAWRFWEHHHGIYRQPLMDDRERETEALVGLAIGEAEKLWAYTRRRGDKYGKREALETAAAVAMKLHRKGGLFSAGGYEEPYLMQDPRTPYSQSGFPQSGYSRSGRSRYRPNRGRSSSVSPLDFDGRSERRGYSSNDDSSDYDRDIPRSPTLASTYIGSPSVASASVVGGYGRRRSSSFYGGGRSQYGGTPYIPPIDGSALSTSPSGGIMIPPPPVSTMGGYYPGSSYGGAPYGGVPGGALYGGVPGVAPYGGAPYGGIPFGSTHEYRDANGTKVHRTIHGDPTSEYGHLPPGTYMITGGSSSSSRRRRHRRYS